MDLQAALEAVDVKSCFFYSFCAVVSCAVLYRIWRPYVKAKAKKIMTAMLNDAGLVVGKDVIIHDEEIFMEWMRNGTLAIGETFMAGQWEAKIPLDEVLYKLLTLPYETKKRLFKSWSTRFVGLYAKIFNFTSESEASKLVAAHYNLGNDFYSKWLGENMQYTCGYWKDADNLDQAQLNKMHLVAKKLKLEPGMHVLELGCGWGKLACFLAKNYSVKVTAVNISVEQVKFARQEAEKLGLSDKVQFLLQDYRECTGQFDRVAAVGILEHVGYENLNEFYSVISKCLKMGGLAIVHVITLCKTIPFQDDKWIKKYIFPIGYLPSPAQMCLASEMKLTVEDMQCFGPDYYRTLMAWYDNYEKSGVGEAKGPEFDRMWKYYLLYGAAAMRARKTGLSQVVYSKHRYERYDAPR